MDMAEDGTPNVVSSLLEKDATNEDLIAMWKEAEETNSLMNKMETLVLKEPREYMSQNKTTLASKVKATLKKVSKILRKAPRKKRTTLYPIVGAVLKFHKDDDDVDPADAGSACRS